MERMRRMSLSKNDSARHNKQRPSRGSAGADGGNASRKARRPSALGADISAHGSLPLPAHLPLRRNEGNDRYSKIISATFRSNGALGLQFVRGHDSETPVLNYIRPGTQAEQLLQLRPGMLLKSVARESLAQRTYAEALTLLRAAARPLVLEFHVLELRQDHGAYAPPQRHRPLAGHSVSQDQMAGSPSTGKNSRHDSKKELLVQHIARHGLSNIPPDLVLGSFPKQIASWAEPQGSDGCLEITYREPGPLGIVWEARLDSSTLAKHAFVKRVKPGSPSAGVTPLKPGLQLHAISNITVASRSYEQIVAELRESKRPLTISLMRPSAAKIATMQRQAGISAVKSWLQRKGLPPTVAHQLEFAFERLGVQPNSWIDDLEAMTEPELNIFMAAFALNESTMDLDLDGMTEVICARPGPLGFRFRDVGPLSSFRCILERANASPQGPAAVAVPRGMLLAAIQLNPPAGPVHNFANRSYADVLSTVRSAPRPVVLWFRPYTVVVTCNRPGPLGFEFTRVVLDQHERCVLVNVDGSLQGIDAEKIGLLPGMILTAIQPVASGPVCDCSTKSYDETLLIYRAASRPVCLWFRHSHGSQSTAASDSVASSSVVRKWQQEEEEQMATSQRICDASSVRLSSECVKEMHREEEQELASSNGKQYHSVMQMHKVEEQELESRGKTDCRLLMNNRKDFDSVMQMHKEEEKELSDFSNAQQQQQAAPAVSKLRLNFEDLRDLDGQNDLVKVTCTAPGPLGLRFGDTHEKTHRCKLLDANISKQAIGPLQPGLILTAIRPLATGPAYDLSTRSYADILSIVRCSSRPVTLWFKKPALTPKQISARSRVRNGDLTGVAGAIKAGGIVGSREDESAASPLHEAAAAGHDEIVRLLVRNGAPLEQTCKKTGFTPLLTAAKAGHHACVAALVEEGADVTVTSARGLDARFLAKKFPLVLAALDNWKQPLRPLPRTLPDDEIDAAFPLHSRLHANAQNVRDDGEDHQVRYLQEQEGSCKCDAAMTHHVDDLCKAIMDGITGDALSKMIGLCGPKVLSATDSAGKTCLYAAASHGYASVVKQLVSAGANLNATSTNSCMTPLHIAAASGHAEIVLYLLQAGADRALKNRRGKTALVLAQQLCRHAVLDVLTTTDDGPSTSQLNLASDMTESTAQRLQSLKHMFTDVEFASLLNAVCPKDDEHQQDLFDMRAELAAAQDNYKRAKEQLATEIHSRKLQQEKLLYYQKAYGVSKADLAVAQQLTAELQTKVAAAKENSDSLCTPPYTAPGSLQAKPKYLVGAQVQINSKNSAKLGKEKWCPGEVLEIQSPDGIKVRFMTGTQVGETFETFVDPEDTGSIRLSSVDDPTMHHLLVEAVTALQAENERCRTENKDLSESLASAQAEHMTMQAHLQAANDSLQSMRIQQDANPKYHAGAQVQIYSVSKEKWCPGEVLEIQSPDGIKVRFMTGTQVGETFEKFVDPEDTGSIRLSSADDPTMHHLLVEAVTALHAERHDKEASIQVLADNLAKLQAEKAKVTENLRSSKENATNEAARSAALSDRLAAMQTQHEAAVTDVETTHKAELIRLTSSFKKKKKKDNKNAGSALQLELKTTQARVDELQNRLGQLQKEQAATILIQTETEESKIQLQEKLDGARLEQMTVLTQHERKQQLLERKYEEAVKARDNALSVAAEHTDAIMRLESLHSLSHSKLLKSQAALKSVEEMHELSVEVIEAGHKQAVLDLKTKHSEQLLELRTEFKELGERAVADLLANHNEKTSKRETELEVDSGLLISPEPPISSQTQILSKQKAEHNAAMSTLIADHAEALQSTEVALRARVDAVTLAAQEAHEEAQRKQTKIEALEHELLQYQSSTDASATSFSDDSSSRAHSIQLHVMPVVSSNCTQASSVHPTVHARFEIMRRESFGKLQRSYTRRLTTNALVAWYDHVCVSTDRCRLADVFRRRLTQHLSRAPAASLIESCFELWKCTVGNRDKSFIVLKSSSGSAEQARAEPLLHSPLTKPRNTSHMKLRALYCTPVRPVKLRAGMRLGSAEVGLLQPGGAPMRILQRASVVDNVGTWRMRVRLSKGWASTIAADGHNLLNVWDGNEVHLQKNKTDQVDYGMDTAICNGDRDRDTETPDARIVKSSRGGEDATFVSGSKAKPEATPSSDEGGPESTLNESSSAFSLKSPEEMLRDLFDRHETADGHNLLNVWDSNEVHPQRSKTEQVDDGMDTAICNGDRDRDTETPDARIVKS
eukprot:SAG31_NODE_52_length_30366_cov_34.368586_6_plen_2235_part_00